MTDETIKGNESTNRKTQEPLEAYAEFIREREAIHNELLTAQARKLTDYAEHARQTCTVIEGYQEQARMLQMKLEEELITAQRELENHTVALKARKKQEKEATEKYLLNEIELSESAKDRIELAWEIDYQKLKKLKLKDKESQAHGLFKWMLNVLYDEPQSKYDWNNFRKQALTKTRSNDLRERLAKLSAAGMRHSHVAATKRFCAEQFRALSQFADVRKDVGKVVNVAELILRTIEISKQQESLLDSNAEAKKAIASEQEIVDRAASKVLGLENRIELATKHISFLKSITEELRRKADEYDKVAEELSRMAPPPLPVKPKSSMSTTANTATLETYFTLQSLETEHIPFPDSVNPYNSERQSTSECHACRSCSIF